MKNFIKKNYMSIINIFLTIVIIILSIFNISYNLKTKNEIEENKINIVLTHSFLYDWTKELIKDRENKFELFLIDNNNDKNYSPSKEEINLLNNADMIIYFGGNSDDWLITFLKNNENVNRKELNVFGYFSYDLSIPNKTNNINEFNENIWMSLRYSLNTCYYIASELMNINPENETTIYSNYINYADKIVELDNLYYEKINNKRIVVPNLDNFFYLSYDYNLDLVEDSSLNFLNNLDNSMTYIEYVNDMLLKICE